MLVLGQLPYDFHQCIPRHMDEDLQNEWTMYVHECRDDGSSYVEDLDEFCKGKKHKKQKVANMISYLMMAKPSIKKLLN